MLEQVWQRCRAAKKLDRLLIATDDDRIADVARGFGADVRMTSPKHPSGTDRVAEVVQALDGSYRVVVNIQGDEPLLTPTSLDRLIAVFESQDPPQMATLAEPIEDVDELFDPNVVKLVVDDRMRALYFSRSPIPYHRGQASRLDTDFRAALAKRDGGLAGYRKHQGIYAYRTATLKALTERGPSALELDEGLEQLRALQAGCSVHVVDSDFRSMPVDTPADLQRVTKILLEAT